MTGRLIVFEGADASGKSTQARRLAMRLGAELTFQFGATEIGGAIRGILLDPAHAALDWLRSKPWVAAPIVGANRPDQLIDAIGRLDQRLGPEALARLDDVSDFYRGRASLET